jgi:hypothetical protein
VFVDRNVSVPAPSCSPCLAKFLVNDTDKAVLDYKNTDWPTQLSPSSAIQQGFSVPKFSHHQVPPKPHLPNHFAAQNSPPHSFETRSNPVYLQVQQFMSAMWRRNDFRKQIESQVHCSTSTETKSNPRLELKISFQ